MPKVYCECECLHNMSGVCAEEYITLDCGGECQDWLEKLTEDEKE